MKITKVDGDSEMGLKAPGILTFMVSVILTVIVLISMFFEAQIPFLSNGKEFWALLLAQIILILGCIMRGL